ncbi:MAG TPA: archease [Anaerolineae bacterium]
MNEKRYEEIPHTADWSFRAYGRDLNELFENAAYAMFAMEGTIPPDAATRVPEVTRTVEAGGIDYESVLVNWLNELLYLQDTRQETFFRFEIDDLSPQSLRAHVYGRSNANIEKLVKAATFHDLKIERTPEGWQAVVVVDV